MVQNVETELGRLQELMPASGRMLCRLLHSPQQPTVLEVPLPLPWQRGPRTISINLNLWDQLPEAQRDLLLLRSVSWNVAIRWFKVDWNQGLAASGLMGGVIEATQGDAIGVVVAGGLVALAVTQIWRSQHSSEVELEADEMAVQTAQRRGYTDVDAARHLLAAIESVARLEGRPTLSFIELLRCQRLKAIAGLSPLTGPPTAR